MEYLIYTSKSSEKLQALGYLLGKPNTKVAHGLDNSLNQVVAINKSQTHYRIEFSQLLYAIYAL